MKKFTAAIIGCGSSSAGKGGSHSISYAHAEGFRRCPEVQLVAAASRTRKNVDDFTAEFKGCKGYQDYHEMLCAEKPQIVSVCAFPPDREAMVMSALENGAIGVWIEKPFAMTLTSAQRMMQSAEKKKARLFVNHQRRYGKPFEWWRDAVQQEKIGKLEGIDIAQPFGTFMNFGTHLLDVALFALGKERKSVRVLGAVDSTEFGNYQGTKSEKSLLASVRLSDDTRLNIEASSQPCRALPLLRANGTMGFAELLMDPMKGDGSIFRAQFANEKGVTSPSTNEHLHHSEDGALYVSRAAQDIVHALQTGAETRIDVDEAYRGLEIIMGMYESARQRKVLQFPLKNLDIFPLDEWR